MHLQDVPQDMGAMNLLLLLCTVLTAEDTEGLAVVLVTSGLLQAAAEHSSRLARANPANESREEVRSL